MEAWFLEGFGGFGVERSALVSNRGMGHRGGGGGGSGGGQRRDWGRLVNDVGDGCCGSPLYNFWMCFDVGDVKILHFKTLK